MTPILTMTWDRESLSGCQAAPSIAAASSLEHDVLDISCSASPGYRLRRRNRQIEAMRNKEALRDPPSPLSLPCSLLG